MKPIPFFCAVILCLTAIQQAFAEGTWELLQCDNNVTDIYRDGDTMWVSTFGNGVHTFDARTMKRNHYCRANTIIPDDSVNETTKDKTGNLWVATEQGGLARIGAGAGTVFTTANSKIPSNTVNSLAVDSNNVIWASTAGGIVSIAGDSVSPVYQFDRTTLPASADTGYIGTRIVVDKFNNKVAGTSQGIMIIKNDGSMTCHTPLNSCLKSSYVMYVAIDQSQKIWATTHYISGGLIPSLIGTGASCLGPADCIALSSQNYGLKGILSSNNAICVAVAPDSLKWITTADNGISVVDDRNGVTISGFFYTRANSGLPFSRLQPIAFDALGRAWIGTRRSGFIIFDGKTWQTVEISANKMPCNTTMQVIIDKNDRRWFRYEDEVGWCANFTGVTGTDGAIWNLFDSETHGLPNCYTRIWSDPAEICPMIFGNSNLLYSIEKDTVKYIVSNSIKIDSATTVTCDYFGEKTLAFEKNGTIWFQCSTGIVEWKNRKDWVYHDKTVAPFLVGRKPGIAVAPDGAVWSAIIDSGFIKYDHSAWTFMKYDSLPMYQTLSDIVPDSKGGAWATVTSSAGPNIRSHFLHFDGTAYKNIDNGRFTDYYGYQKYLDGADRLWVTTSKGLLMSDGDSAYLFNSANSNLQTDFIDRICSGRDGTLYFCGTNRSSWAVQIYTFAGSAFTLLYESPPMRSTINDFAVDSKNNFYMATSNGILTFKPGGSTGGLRAKEAHNRRIAGVRVRGDAVRFTLTGQSECVIDVFSADGRILSTFHAGKLTAGFHAIPFSRFSKSTGIGSGVRFVRIRTGNNAAIASWVNVR